VEQILFITANPKTTEESTSLSLGQEFLKAYKEAKPEDEVIVIDLYDADIPEIDYELMDVIGKLKMGKPLGTMIEQTRKRFERYNQLTDQFVNADKYIFVTPMWNLGLPPRVKTYIDTIFVVGKTFKYTAKGPEGLLKTKKCLHLHASGGFHSKDPMNHSDSFLRDVFKFMGVDDFRSLIVEGHAAVPDRAQTIIKEAYAKIPSLVKWFA